MRQGVQSRRQHGKLERLLMSENMMLTMQPERPCQEDTSQSLAQIVYRFFFLVVTLRSTP